MASRHVGLATLGGIGIVNTIATAFCGSYDPANPVTIGSAVIITIITVADWIKNNNKLPQ